MNQSAYRWSPPPHPWSSPSAPPGRSGWHPGWSSRRLASALSQTFLSSAVGTGPGCSSGGASWWRRATWASEPLGSALKRPFLEIQRAGCIRASVCWERWASPRRSVASRRSDRRAGCPGTSRGKGPRTGRACSWRECVSRPWLKFVLALKVFWQVLCPVWECWDL